MDSLLPISADGIEYPVYSLVREKLKDVLIVNFPNGDWAARLLSPELTANSYLPLFFVIALPNAIMDSWIQARTYPGIAANVLNHFPMKQLNCFMSLQGSITKLIYWMAQGHMESYWNDTLSFITAPMAECLVLVDYETGPTVGILQLAQRGLDPLVISQFSISHR